MFAQFDTLDQIYNNFQSNDANDLACFSQQFQPLGPTISNTSNELCFQSLERRWQKEDALLEQSFMMPEFKGTDYNNFDFGESCHMPHFSLMLNDNHCASTQISQVAVHETPSYE